MQSFSYLEYRMNQKSILKFRVMINEELKHHFTKLVFHTNREVIKETK